MVKKNAFIAALLLFVSANSQSFAAIITTIGSASVVQGSSDGFFNVPISISSDAGPVKMGAYLAGFTVSGRTGSLAVFNQSLSNSTLFNTPGLIGFNNFDPSSYRSTSPLPAGTNAILSLISLSGPDDEPAENFGIDVDAIGGVLAYLPVSTNLPIGEYQLVGGFDLVVGGGGIQNSRGDFIDGPFNIGTFTVTAVPEPSTFALLIVVGLSGVAIRRLRRSKSVVIR